MARSCSNWWQAPTYVSVSVVLAFIAISSAIHSQPKDAVLPTKPISHQLCFNASMALRKAGFNSIAMLLLISPEIFFSSPNSTIFAINDSAIFNASLLPWLRKDLLKYHTFPFKLSMDDLLKKPQGTCFPTLLRFKNVVITKVDAKERLLELNHVFISHPDIFLQGNIAIHGVLRPFPASDPKGVLTGSDFVQAPVCDSDFSLVAGRIDSRIKMEWTRIIRLLSSNGFVSFAIALHSVLDGILEDFIDLKSVTIFTPPDFELVASNSPWLDKIVRFHILPQMYSYKEIASLPKNTLLKTLAPDQDLEITGFVNLTKDFTINGVEIMAPDVFSSRNFIVHGISRAFEMGNLPNTST